MGATTAIVLTALSSCATVSAPPPTELRGAVEPALKAAGPLTLGPDWVERAPQPRGSFEEEEQVGPWAKFSLSAGGLITAVDSKVRFGPSGVGIGVDVEDLLGFDTELTSFGLEGSWRFTENRRHKVSLAWSDLTRKSDKTLAQDLDLGNGTILPAGSSVATQFGVNVFRTQYAYSFFQDERMDLALVGGLYVMPLDFQLEATGLQPYSDSFSITAPLPLTGLGLDFAITPKVLLRSRMELFFLDVGDYRGRMLDTALAFEWRAWEHFALGMGVDSFELDVQREGSTTVPGVPFTGRVAFSYYGLRLYLRGLW
jgi:hypothetical protein